MGADALAPATLQPKVEWKPAHQQPDLNTVSSFGSQNLSKSNQSHQTRRSELKWFESARFEYFFKLWQPKPVQKESKSPNQKIRIIELRWFESARFWIFFQAFGSQNLSKSNQSHQTRRSELSNWNGLIQQNLITFSSFGSQNLHKRNQNIWNRCMYSWAVSRVRSGPGPVPVRDRVCGKPGVPWECGGTWTKWWIRTSHRYK